MSRRVYDLLFECDASPSVGFGHVARCIALARKLTRKNSDLSIAFRGALAAGAIERLNKGCPAAEILPVADCASSRLSVLDTMTDPENPDDWDACRLEKVSKLSTEVLFIASGLTPPDPGAANNVSVVGYQPLGKADSAGKVQWGLRFAPFDRVANDAGVRISTRAVIALGGGENESTANAVLGALANTTFVEEVFYLGSPVGDVVPNRAPLAPTQTLRVVRNVPEIIDLVQSAGILIVSYGNLMFEALALCTPTCVLGIKPFQARYARCMEDLGLAVSVGNADPSSPVIAEALARLNTLKDDLVANCARTFKESGLDTLAAMITERLGTR